MALTFTGSTGLITWIAGWISLIRNVNGIRASTAPAGPSCWGSGGNVIHDVNTAFSNIIAANASSLKPFQDGIYSQKAALQTAIGQPLSSFKTFVQQYFINAVNADTPLSSLTLQAAMNEFIRQMVSQSQTVAACTVSASVTAGTNTGNPVLLSSFTDGQGNTLEYAFPEKISFTVPRDANSGATAGSEGLTFAGEAPNSPDSTKFNWLWPAGSGCSGTVTIVNPMLSTGANGLYNSSFEAFSAGAPTNWNITVGGTILSQSTATTHASYSIGSLQIAGDGSTMPSLYQQFNLSSGGTATALAARGVYPFLLYAKVSTITSLAGVLRISLTDGSGTIIANDQGANCSVSFTLASVLTNTSWTALSGWFQLPTNLPAVQRFRIDMTSALTNGTNLFIDDLALATNAVQAYTPGGPYLAAFRGSADVLRGDNWSLTVSNTASEFYGDQQVGVLQTGFNVLFDMREMSPNLSRGTLPSSATPTITDMTLVN